MRKAGEIFSKCLIWDFLKPHKIWAHLPNFCFHCFLGGTKGKTLENQHSNVFFFLWSPLWNEENKSCLNELKFCEVSEIPKSRICWKFHLSISWGIKKSPSTIQAGTKLNKPFWKLSISWCFKFICLAWFYSNFYVSYLASSFAIALLTLLFPVIVFRMV